MEVRIGQTTIGSYIAYKILQDSSFLVGEGVSIEDAKTDFLKALEKVRQTWEGQEDDLTDLLESASFVYDEEFDSQAEQLHRNLRIQENLRYIEWRNELQSSIMAYESRFFTPWIPFVPVVLLCAPKHVKYRWKKRKKRIIKKWYHRYERENFSDIRSLRNRCPHPGKKRIKEVMLSMACETYRKSHNL